MYKQFFGLTERPFDLTANPRFLYVSAGHREAISLLQYGLEADKGITVLIGEAGTGKTTLLSTVLGQQRGAHLFCVHLNTPPLTRHELYTSVGSSIRLSGAAQSSRTTFLRDLEQFLRDRRSSGARTAIIIDEAQGVPIEVLEEIRHIANLESPTGKLLSVILSGQPELARRLNDPALYALKQRVALRSTLRPLDVHETAAYIAKRIRIAGGDAAALLTKEAVVAVHRGSRGIPRTISVICDNALITAYAMQVKPIGADVIAEVCSDLDIEGVSPSPMPGHSPVTNEHVYALDDAPSPISKDLLGTPRPLAAVTPIVDTTERPGADSLSSEVGNDDLSRRPAQVIRGPGSL